MLTAFIASSLIGGPSKPALTVILSIDQFRSDYLYRFKSDYLPAKKGNKIGGFNYLLENGANFVNAKYRHLPTATGPGHAVIGTGSTPGITGIVGNEWYDKTHSKKDSDMIYCVEDPEAKDVLTGKPSMSPKNLWVSTIGDELKLATAGRAQVVSIAIKDRASILLSGHASDDVLWYQKSTGRWTTSDFYAKSGKLSPWVEALNNRKLPDVYKGQQWTNALTPGQLADTFPTAAPAAPSGFGSKFPHTLGSTDAFYDLFTYTPMANQFVVDSAEAAIEAHKMGQDDVPDLLTLNFSSNDYLGHRFGPYSPEVKEMSVGTDRAISNLLNYLNEKVGLDKVLFVLSADHGVVPVIEDLKALKIPGLRLGSWAGDIKKKITAVVGSDVVGEIGEGQLWLDPVKVAASGQEVASIRKKIADILRVDPMIYRAYSVEDSLNLAPGDDLLETIRRNIESSRGADVYFIYKPGVYDSPGGTGHGTSWIYDTSIPLVFAGPGLDKGRHTTASGPEDIAATVCYLMGIIAPSGSIGKVIGITK